MTETEKLNKLAMKLNKLSSVIQFDSEQDKEAWVLAYSFLELQESFNKFNDELLPSLVNKNLSDTEMKNILHEIGEEFRHILYHIRDPQSYDYLFPVEKFEPTDTTSKSS